MICSEQECADPARARAFGTDMPWDIVKERILLFRGDVGDGDDGWMRAMASTA